MAPPSPLHGDLEQELGAPAETLLDRPLHPKVRRLTEYWIAIRPPGRLPGRDHFEPMDVPTLLPNLWLVDVHRAPALRFRYRLVGTSIARAFDGDPTGTYLDELKPGSRDDRVESSLGSVVRTGEASWRAGRPRLWRLHDYVRVERIYLPLARDGSTVDMILAATLFLDRFGQEL
ncbi:MAG: PAS domain-containing protein [Thalassobaculum sp.]|uniref:PAS domain-containing protein n=1 Tax=Thalassobaculum sp. TaxID=2022740 RepID=UPI0032ECD1F2